MFKKDYIVRQFEEFGKFMAIIFGLKKDGKWDELEKVINESSQKYLSANILEIESLSDEEIPKTLANLQLNESNLKILGDLLYEKGLLYTELFKEEESENAMKKAHLIYSFLKDNALEIDFSLDMYFKMKAIEQLLGK